MNKQLLFVKRPVGVAGPDTWSLETSPIPEISEGQILVRQHYVSLDPAMRGWMNEGKSYIEPMALGSVMRAGSVGEVVAAKNHPLFNEGDFVVGSGGVQQYVATDGKGFHKVDPRLAPLPTYLGALGMPGMTAYFGILEVGKIKEGDVVVVSGAAGAVEDGGEIIQAEAAVAVDIPGGGVQQVEIVQGFEILLEQRFDHRTLWIIDQHHDMRQFKRRIPPYADARRQTLLNRAFRGTNQAV